MRAGSATSSAAKTAPVLRAVLRAFDPTTTKSRLVITSRFPFQLEGLEAGLLDLPLPPLSPAAQRKLELRQRTAVLSGRSERERAEGARLIAERIPLLERVPGLARGNPGLQDLIGRKLVLSPAVTAGACRAGARGDGGMAGAGRAAVGQ